MAYVGSDNPALPKPVVENGRFQMPWHFTHPGFGKVLKFLCRAKDYSNIPVNSEVTIE